MIATKVHFAQVPLSLVTLHVFGNPVNRAGGLIKHPTIQTPTLYLT